jgi:hypothetical protein
MVKFSRLNPKLRSFPLHVRKHILKTQGNKCANKNCKWKSQYPIFPIWAFETDHIKEVADGGLTTIDNGQVLCKGCHPLKSQIMSRIRWSNKLNKHDLHAIKILESFKLL